MSLGRAVWREVRKVITDLLSEDNPQLRDNAELRERVLIPMVLSPATAATLSGHCAQCLILADPAIVLFARARWRC